MNEDKIKKHQNLCLGLLKDLNRSKYRPVLLLASYCYDNVNCTDYNPCEECLKMCNIAIIKEKNIREVVCGYEFLDIYR